MFRRRNSYSMYIFYGLQFLTHVSCFGFSICFYIITRSRLEAVDTECVEPSHDGSQPYAITCGQEDRVLPSCPGSTMYFLLVMYPVTGTLLLLQSLTSLLLAYGFRFFSNITREELQHSTSSRQFRVYGLACKQGPWVSRFLHLVLVLIALVFLGMVPLGHVCEGRIEVTSQCNPQSKASTKCAYYQARNCQYYWTYCQNKLSNVNQLISIEYCMTETGALKGTTFRTREHFYGSADIRLVKKTESVGARCAFLLAQMTQYEPAPLQTSPPTPASTHVPTSSPTVAVNGAAQMCSGYPTTPSDFWYDSDICLEAQNSLIFRHTQIYTLAILGLEIVTTLLGQAVRLKLQPEPWFYNPPTIGECSFFRLLRKVAP